MKRFKRSLAMLLALCMLISSVPFYAFATESAGAPSASAVVEEAPAEEAVSDSASAPDDASAPDSVSAPDADPADGSAAEDAPGEDASAGEAPADAEPIVNAAADVAETDQGAASQALTEIYDLTYADDYRILHLDCGRKYFTKDWIIALINEMAAAGYTHLELAFGNDGLRFLLDDMSVGSYSDDAVTAAIQAGNKAYYDAGDVNELTQSEMDEIIAHAKSVGIAIIPLLNTPGHMDAIVSAISSLTGSEVGYNGSGSTINLEETTAVEFTKELVQKYITYFDGKGCNEFNMGADEYANDVYSTGSMGFGALVSAKKYQLFVNYVNDMAEMIESAGMVPMAFNDGIYFNKDTSYAFDTQIMVTFWTSGWTGYQSADASTMRNLGHEMINVHGDYYYVLGKSDNWDSNTYTYASNWSNTAFMGSTVPDPKGSMFCIWCDYPGAETETQIAANARLILRAMAAEMQSKDASSISTDVVPGGFNEDGSINVVDTRSWVTVTATDNSGIAVSGYDLTALDVKEAEAPVIDGAANVKAWDITPSVDGVAYTEKGTVKLPVPAEWNTTLLTGFYVENGSAVLVEGEYADGYYTFDMPHFSVAGVAELAYDHLIELTVCGSKTVIIEGTDLTGNTYTPEPAGIASVATAVHNVTASSNLVQVTSLDNLVSGGKYVLVNKRSGHVLGVTTGYASTWGTTCLVQSNETASASSPYWTITVNGSNYYFQNSNGSYMTIASNYSNLTTTQTALTMYAYGNSTFGVAQNGYYLNDMGGAGQYAGGYNLQNDAGAPWYIYRIVETQPSNGTEVTFAGTVAGETFVTINNEVYKIVVGKAAVTANLVVNGTKTYTDASTNVTVDDSAVADAVLNNGTLTITGKAVGTTTVTTDTTVYTVTVTEEDLSAVVPLKLEYWITNGQVTDPATNQTYIEISATQSGIHSTEGVAITALVPNNLQREGRTVEYWQTKLLDVTVSNDSTSGTQEQTLYTGDDETLNDASFTRVRYWNGAWQALVGTTWTAVNRTKVTVKTYSNNEETGTSTRETHQLVVYYMEIVDIANSNGETELHVNAADWGFKSGDEWGYWTSDYGAYTISFQIVYEDNTTNPGDDSVIALLSKTLVYAEWAERGIGTIIFDGEGDYQIYKVTAETGDVKYTNNYNGFTVDNLTWDDNEETVWSGNPTDSVTIGNNARNPRYDGIYSNLVWHNTANGNNPANDAILIRVYVRAEATKDALNVHYLDKTANNLEFYNYAIAVNEGTVFDTGFAMGGDKNSLVNNTVVNHNGVTQTVSADLATMPQIKAYYRYCNYTLTEVVRSENGKDVYLYYEFTPVVSFVADFGLPIKITPTDLNQEGYTTVASDIKAVKVIGTYDTEASSTAHAEYGTLSVSGTTVTYTPTEIMQGVDFFTIYVVTQLDDVDTTENDEAGIAYRVYVFPATTVYYEENFLTTDSNWTAEGTAKNAQQSTVKLGLAGTNNYGYDAVYADDGAVASNGTYIATKEGTTGATATFTFTGTGFELYANSNSASGYVTVYSQGELSKLYMINTKLSTGDTAATNQQSGGTYYSLLIISETALPYGTYTVQLKQTKDEGPIYIDGVRIINTIDESALTDSTKSIYYADKEDNPAFYELRDCVLKGIGVEDLNESKYIDATDRVGKVDAVKSMAGQVYDSLADEDGNVTAEALIINTANSRLTTEQLQDLLDNGPKNELYLYPGQTLAFSVSTNRVMQLGLKSPTGSAQFKITVSDETTSQTLDLSSLSTTVDMFYKIAEKGGTTHTVSISVSEGLLSVTDLKICDDPNFTFNDLTQKDIENVLMDLYDLSGTTEGETPVQPEAPVEPELPEEPVVSYADAVLTVTLKDYTGAKLGTVALTRNGVAGEAARFTAGEILAAAKAQLPEKYALADETAVADAEVVYGETQEAEVLIGKVATLNITFVNWRGKKQGTASITAVQTSGGYCRVSASRIRALAPAGRSALWLIPAIVSYGSMVSIVVPVF